MVGGGGSDGDTLLGDSSDDVGDSGDIRDEGGTAVVGIEVMVVMGMEIVVFIRGPC